MGANEYNFEILKDPEKVSISCAHCRFTADTIRAFPVQTSVVITAQRKNARKLVLNGKSSSINSMPKSNKKINGAPRRKKMQRSNRLQAAKHWVPTYNGKNLIKAYQKWFGVNFACAVKELKILGIKLDDEYVHQVIHNQEKKLLAKRHEIEKKKQRQELEYFINSDEYLAYIAGYTSNGFPYGVTWEEMEKLEENTLELSETKTA